MNKRQAKKQRKKLIKEQGEFVRKEAVFDFVKYEFDEDYADQQVNLMNPIKGRYTTTERRMEMKRLIENGGVVLDGTDTREEKEKKAFESLGRIEDILEKHNIVSIEHLDEVLTNSRKKVNLAKALCDNKNCLGFITRLNNGKHVYQNDNDLGLDLEGLDFKAPYEKKIYLYKRYYCYYFVEDLDDERGEGVDLETAKALLKECHDHFIPLTDKEKEICDNYWRQF